MKTFFRFLLRLPGFLLRLAILGALVVWIADSLMHPGTARIVWHDYIIETSAGVLGLGVLGIALVLYILFRIWHFIWHGPERWRLKRRIRKAEKGQHVLTAGLAAIAAGDAAEAGRFAVSARKLLGNGAATQLLQAQAAQLAGDHRSAREIFRTLAADPESAVLGYRGLIMEARRNGDWPEVERLIDRLREIRPDTPWLNLIRFELLTRQQDWREAEQALSHASSARLLGSGQAKQNHAALLIAISQDSARAGELGRALGCAEQASRLAGDWLPAVLNLAQMQTTAGHRRAALRTIEKYWSRTPHTQLASIYASNETNALEGFKNLEKLCRDTPDAGASHLALAEAALAADVWGEARRHLMILVGRGDATQGVYRLLARLERRESGGEQAALQWMTKAADAPIDPTWLCRSCGGTHGEWRATCSHCGGFNTMEWQSPGQSAARIYAPALPSLSWID
jgi:HemY protein